jgi:Tfp pilus assembly protein PilN
MLQASRASYYADDLGRDLPVAILLSGMNINPFQKPKTEEEKISFQNKTIRVTGFCNQSLELNDWMQGLKKKTWVKNLVLLNYSQGKGMSSGEFLLQMDIK